MIIFNTTYCVAKSEFPKWENWVYQHHVPQMLETGYFAEPRVCKVLNPAEDSEDSYSVQFHIADMDALLEWNDCFGDRLKTEFQGTFGTDVLYFSTFLDVLL